MDEHRVMFTAALPGCVLPRWRGRACTRTWSPRAAARCRAPAPASPRSPGARPWPGCPTRVRFCRNVVRCPGKTTAKPPLQAPTQTGCGKQTSHTVTATLPVDGGERLSPLWTWSFRGHGVLRPRKPFRPLKLFHKWARCCLVRPGHPVQPTLASPFSHRRWGAGSRPAESEGTGSPPRTNSGFPPITGRSAHLGFSPRQR